MRFATALLAAALPLLANGQAQLLPAGEFTARDGRPGKNLTWKVTDEVGNDLATRLNALAEKTPIVIDYEHQTMLAPDNGQRAPAAGWITSVEWRKGEGLFAQVDWTDSAKQHIDAKEYRFISPVIDYDRKSGVITGLHNAALTNFPALTGMKPVVAQLSAQFSSIDDNDDQEPTVDLSALLTQLGLAATATPEQTAAHINGVKAMTEQVAQLRTALGLAADAPLTEITTSLTALKSKLDLAETASLADMGTALVTLRAKVGQPDPATLESMQALQSEVSRLTTVNLTREVNEVVDTAVKGLKLTPALRQWAVDMGMKDVASLRSFIAAVPAVVGLGGQSGGKGPGDDGKTTDQAALSVATAMGVSAEQFAKAAKASA